MTGAVLVLSHKDLSLIVYKPGEHCCWYREKAENCIRRQSLKINNFFYNKKLANHLRDHRIEHATKLQKLTVFFTASAQTSP